MLFLFAILAAPPGYDELVAMFAHDPPIAELHEATLEVHGVPYDQVFGYGRNARLRGLLPSSVTLGYTRDANRNRGARTDRLESGGLFDPANPQRVSEQYEVGRSFAVGVEWSPGSLVFDSAQLGAYSLIPIYKEALGDINKYYYRRQHLLIALTSGMAMKTRSEIALVIELRLIDAMLEELTAGYWWSKASCTSAHGTAEFDPAKCSARPPSPISRRTLEELRRFDHDPPIAEIQRLALDFYRVNDTHLTAMRSSARLKGLLPTVVGSHADDEGTATDLSVDRIRWPQPLSEEAQVTEQDGDVGRANTASVSWKPGSLLYDGSQLEAYSLLAIHEDVREDITIKYFKRQELLLSLAVDPPADARARATLLSRLAELESMLHVMTGGAWLDYQPGE